MLIGNYVCRKERGEAWPVIKWLPFLDISSMEFICYFPYDKKNKI
jgi:hypothetical protein